MVIDFDFWMKNICNSKYDYVTVWSIKQSQRTRKIIHLIHNNESNRQSRLCISTIMTTLLFISLFAVMNKHLRVLSLLKIYSRIDLSINLQ